MTDLTRTSEAVAAALRGRAPVVAPESTVLAHGLPRSRNLEVGRALEDAVRAGGALPATVAATMYLAQRVGVELFATGGIGGVHRGDTRDVSADLTEPGRTPKIVVCAGAKSVLELPGTREALETAGVREATPFPLRAIAESTGGKSLEANVALLLNNAQVAAALA